jgi:predicted acylesterase/phospholipase RssA
LHSRWCETIDILCGTSVGAIHASLLAAFADEPRRRATRLAEHWTSLRLDELGRADARARHDELCALVESMNETRAAA